MNKITSHEDELKSPEITIHEEYRYPRKNTSLKYILYRRETEEKESYSIQCVRSVDGTKVCQATAADVSSEYDFAMEIFTIIADGEVEPVHLHDVIYDLLP